MQKSYDAIVIGGGPAGATAAIVLAEAGWSVALVEQNSFPRRKVCGEYLSQTNWTVLDRLGLSACIQARAGPEVTHMAVFAGKRSIRSELPSTFGSSGNHGRALTRDILDTLLLSHAQYVGVEVFQPWKVLSAARGADGFHCELQSRQTRERVECDAKILVAANGSWEADPLKSPRRPRERSHDLFGFKAHYRNASLPDGLMPLLSFDRGYGGMVCCQDGLTSLSCCIQRGCLSRLRDTGDSAGERVFAHIRQSCPVIDTVLENAVRDGPWLSAGPIRPGIRSRYSAGIFSVGNAAAEAHPVIAEGITIAIQSAWLMGLHLAPLKHKLDDRKAIDAAGRAYAAAWSSAFATRIHASTWIAHWAMHPRLVQAAFPIFNKWPGILKRCAEIAGKASQTFQPHEALQKVAL